MGQYSDNYSQAEDRRSAIESAILYPPRLEPTQPTEPTYDCAACPSQFGSDAALQRHIHDAHPTSSYYIRLNGVIAQDLVFIEEPLTQLELVPIGGRDLSVEIRWVNGREAHKIISSGNVLDLVAIYGPVAAPGEVRLSCKVSGGRERFHRINVIDLPDVDLSIANELIVESQQPLSVGRPANFEPLRDAAEREDDETVERYLSGFASYLLACNLELNGTWQAARERFEETYPMLRPFATSLARDVRAILEFRRHDMRRLHHRGPTSVWWQAANFFSAPPVIIETTVAPAGEGIWVDDYQIGLLEAVDAHCVGDYARALRLVEGLPGVYGGEPGNVVKKNIIGARAASAAGDRIMARRLYTSLREDRIYAAEAARWL